MNLITLEFCTEDRARIDRLISALEKRATQEETPIPTSYDPDSYIKRALTEALDTASKPTETPQNAPQAMEAPTEAETPIKEETPTDEATACEEKPEVILSADIIQQKVMELCKADNGKKKGKVKEIVTSYAPTVSKIPEDKWTEVWEKLIALESEVVA